MSWISGLADKAENILNKLDQNAATALQGAGEAQEPAASSLMAIGNSLSTSTQSLKASLSPIRTLHVRASSMGQPATGITSYKMTQSLELPTETYETRSKGEGHYSNSRRSSEDVKAASIAIDISDMQEAGSQKVGKQDDMVGTSQELAAFKIALAQVTTERDDLRLRLSAISSDMENSHLRQRTQELESLLLRLSEERDQAVDALKEAQSSSNAYMRSTSELESSLAKMQQDYMNVNDKLKMQIRETEQLRLDLQQYRIKAQRALANKDALAAELKLKSQGSLETSGTLTAQSSGDEALRLLQMEYEDLKQEQYHSNEENRRLSAHLEEAKEEMSKLKQHYNDLLTQWRGKEESLRRELKEEQQRLLTVESERKVLTQELEALRQQLSNQMASMATRLQAKEQELQKLRLEKLSRTSNSGEDPIQDYSGRMQMLTQTLVEKQNAVERLTVERNALRIQLEKAQLQQQSMYQQQSINQSAAGGGAGSRNPLLSNTTDDIKAQFPLLRENPFDSRVSRRVKRAYTSLDSMGIRMGAFLRRYPLMRTFVLLYVALLHFWVMFVLIASTKN